MRVGVLVNRTKDFCMAEDSLIHLLECYEIEYEVAERVQEFMHENMSVMFVLGGDGTILSVTKYCALRNILIAGINIGKVGFLTTAKYSDIEMLVERIVKNQYRIEERMLIEAGEGNIALNDIVLSRRSEEGGSRVVRINAYINGELLDRYVCDGVICSTPTGSTAYSLSAGGSVIDPGLNALQVVSICPHSLHSRPIVVSAEKRVTFESYDDLTMYVDGENKGEINGKIDIIKYDMSAKFISIDNASFYVRLLEKLGKWSLT